MSTKTDAHHVAETSLLLASTGEHLGVSVISLAEVLVGPARTGRIGRTGGVVQRLQIEELPRPARAAQRLAELRVETRLRLPDCCVLLTAEEHDASVATFGDRLAAAARDMGLEIARG